MLLAALALGGGGCGFQPLYGERAAAPDVPRSLAQVKVAPVADRSGQMLRNYLLDLLNPAGAPSAPTYELVARLQEQQRELAIRRDEVATRVNLTLIAEFRLVRLADGQVVLHDMVRTTNGFNRLRSDFATISAEADARRRSARVLSEEIRARVAIYMGAQTAGRR